MSFTSLVTPNDDLPVRVLREVCEKIEKKMESLQPQCQKLGLGDILDTEHDNTPNILHRKPSKLPVTYQEFIAVLQKDKDDHLQAINAVKTEQHDTSALQKEIATFYDEIIGGIEKLRTQKVRGS